MAKRKWKAGWTLNCLQIEGEWEYDLFDFGHTKEEVEQMTDAEVSDLLIDLVLEEGIACLSGWADPIE